MYFSLPKSQDRMTPLHHEVQTQLIQQHLQQQQEQNDYLSKRSSYSSYESNNTTTINEERISEIIQNLDEHWGSPPILTPNTLAHILSHQWVQQSSNSQEEAAINREEIRKVSKAAAAAASVAANKTLQNNNKLIFTLIEEFIRTIQSIDTENQFDITTEIQSDSVLQKLIAANEEQTGDVSNTKSNSILHYQSTMGENVMKHLIDLLRKHNNGNSNETKKQNILQSQD
ncbi:hypothetical protein BDF20DRAFT_858334 [Mycotypha africana]|uniref:uncharacterized protein n=1 Tax=Mycotypha africana TaxID=64632 RepID=UPI002300FA77|nr:uncharacterized protein BDF20DRAFT_858334 [Mycotypha africana]KAI8984167.1 hypothetical protein BDF20DRAFT_858334 [Mycotypha africana]